MLTPINFHRKVHTDKFSRGFPELLKTFTETKFMQPLVSRWRSRRAVADERKSLHGSSFLACLWQHICFYRFLNKRFVTLHQTLKSSNQGSWCPLAWTDAHSFQIRSSEWSGCTIGVVATDLFQLSVWRGAHIPFQHIASSKAIIYYAFHSHGSLRN